MVLDIDHAEPIRRPGERSHSRAHRVRFGAESSADLDDLLSAPVYRVVVRGDNWGFLTRLGLATTISPT